MPKLANLVAETATASGSGPFSLTGAVSQRRAFAAGYSDGDTVAYRAAQDALWELAIGTYSGSTLTRDTILASSAGGTTPAPFVAGNPITVVATAVAEMLATMPNTIPTGTAVPFRANTQMAQRSVTGALTFTIDTTAAVDGASCAFDLIADGSNVPTFPSPWRQWGGSYVNTNGIRNTIICFRLGGIYYWSVNVAVGATPELPPAAPTFSSTPAIIGTPTIGAATSYTGGTVAGNPTPTVARQWTLDGVDISGATAATYTPVSGDATKTLRVRETASNGVSPAASSTSAGVVIAAAATAPSFSAAPAYSPSPATVGIASTCNTGTVAGTAPITYTYQWKLGGTNISGATASSYTPVAGDAGGSLTCTVTATNSVSSASSTTSAATVTNVAPGAISGLTVGSVTGTSIALSWTAPSAGGTPTDYEIQYAAAGTSFASPTTFSDGTSTTTSATITGLSGGPFDVRVRAVNGAGNGAYVSSLGIALSDPNILTLTNLTSFTASGSVYTKTAGVTSGAWVCTADTGALGLVGDGWISIDFSDAPVATVPNSIGFSLDVTQGQSVTDGCDYLWLCAGNSHDVLLTNATVVADNPGPGYIDAAAGKRLRLLVAGSVVKAQFSTDNGGTWTDYHTFALARPGGKLFAKFWGYGATAGGPTVIRNPRGSGLT